MDTWTTLYSELPYASDVDGSLAEAGEKEDDDVAGLCGAGDDGRYGEVDDDDDEARAESGDEWWEWCNAGCDGEATVRC